MVEKAVSAYVKSAQGAALADVSITIAGQSFKIDSNGLASFKVKIPASASSVAVRLSRSGFINQSVRINVKDLANITANMLDIKQIVAVAKIEDAQAIESSYSNAKIIIPANAFLLPNGQPATGAVAVEFSPWDIQSSDLNAMPANGVAIVANGQVTNLISAGMITVIFKNAAGEHLQLAQGKTADIQMDLPVDSINNQILSAGFKISMWHFDEAKGMWVEEGEGQVISSLSSPVGLAVHATVSHFSTWNWDFKFENSGSVNVKCKSANNYVPCHITATVELKDGSGLTKTNSIPAEGVDIVNMPTEGTIHWTAKDTTGTLIGSVTSQLPNDKNVVIDLGIPATNNKVQCVLEDGSAVECSGEFTALVGVEYKAAEFTAPKEGVRVLTGLKSNNDKLVWSAQTAIALEGDQWVRYVGEAVSTSKSDVKIVLKDKEVVASDKGLSFYVQCTSDYDYGTNTPVSNNAELVNKPCDIQVSVYMAGAEQSHSMNFTTTYAEKKLVRLPNQYAGFQALDEGNISWFRVNGRMMQGQYCGGTGTDGFEKNALPTFYIELFDGGQPSDNPEYFCQMPT